MTYAPTAPRRGKRVVPLSQTYPWAGAGHANDGSLTAGTCVHHWMIDPAFDHTSKGVCKYCGEEREFVNEWFGDRIKGSTAAFLGLKSVGSVAGFTTGSAEYGAPYLGEI
jgi:hypothetical protein